MSAWVAERPYPRLLKALRWKLVPVPFYFRVFRGDRVVSQMPALRRRASARLLGAVPVLASLAFRLLHRFRGGHRKAVALDALTAFSGHETQIWNKVRSQPTFALLRDSDTLNERYRNRAAEGISFARFASGYLVVKLHQFTADTQFGSLRVATWADGVADPGHESELAAASEQLAASLGADLLITNQLYAPLQNALQANGWLSYPSNFLGRLVAPTGPRTRPSHQLREPSGRRRTRPPLASLALLASHRFLRDLNAALRKPADSFGNLTCLKRVEG